MYMLASKCNLSGKSSPFLIISLAFYCFQGGLHACLEIATSAIVTPRCGSRSRSLYVRYRRMESNMCILMYMLGQGMERKNGSRTFTDACFLQIRTLLGTVEGDVVFGKNNAL